LVFGRCEAAAVIATILAKHSLRWQFLEGVVGIFGGNRSQSVHVLSVCNSRSLVYLFESLEFSFIPDK
jgi:hypothetical protein